MDLILHSDPQNNCNEPDNVVFVSVIPGGDPIFSGVRRDGITETIVMSHEYLYTRLFTVNISLLDADGGGGNGEHRRIYTGLCCLN